MNILWIGSVYWRSDNGDYLFNPKDAGSVSASFFSQSIISGVEELGNNIKILGTINHLEKKRMNWAHNGVSNDLYLKGLKNKFFNLFYKTFLLKKEIRSNHRILDSIDIVMVYGAYLPYINCACAIKKKNPNIKIVLVCPDLSEYMDPAINKKPIKKALKSLIVKKLKTKYLQFDGFVVFTDKMMEKLNPNSKHLVIEGVCSDTMPLEPRCTDNRLVLYAGSLSANFGIQNLVDSFSLLKKRDVKLLIYGSGELDLYLSKKSKELDNVFYGGFIEPAELKRKYREAALLINVRNPNDEYTKYSFPSKTFEYLASGTPFMTTKLEGVPPEYDDYCLYINDNNPMTIAESIDSFFDIPTDQRREIGEKGRAFVLNNKNKAVQSEKIVLFLKNL